MDMFGHFGAEAAPVAPELASAMEMCRDSPQEAAANALVQIGPSVALSNLMGEVLAVNERSGIHFPIGTPRTPARPRVGAALGGMQR